MFNDFLAECSVTDEDAVLDIGVTSDQTYASSNYLEAWLEKKSRITAVGIDDASFLEDLYPGLKYVQANGLNLPFASGSFDVVHSSAVLEHVGSLENQIKFISECARVAKKAFCITTPNRHFPVEFHTVLPLVHWLPKKWFRSLMRVSGREFFSREENLNLMSRQDMIEAANTALGIDRFNLHMRSVKLAGWSSNLILYGVAK